MANNVIEIKGIRKKFNGQDILNGVDLSIKEGEFFSILGPSGCGKTSLLKIIAGLIPQDSGTIAISGTDMSHAAPNHRPVNLVFQHYALFPHLNVWDNIAFGLRMKHTPQSDIDRLVKDALAMVRLNDKRKRLPEELSGGERQRVALARAIVNRPKILLLDEPLSNLDLKMRINMRERLRELKEQTGITFLMVTHDQEEALALSTRIAVMRAGLVLQVGAAQEVYESPKDAFVANFVGTSNLLCGAVAETTCEDGKTNRLRVVPSMDALAINNGKTPSIWAQTLPSDEIPQSVGSRVSLAIRPERLHITSTP
ncbi:MAG: ABC transporter ATP-binding protein, partial [Elusimicrobiota bacterium]